MKLSILMHMPLSKYVSGCLCIVGETSFPDRRLYWVFIADKDKERQVMNYDIQEGQCYYVSTRNDKIVKFTIPVIYLTSYTWLK